MMAQDGIKLADHLEWELFHVAGISMGGMISQEIALAVPHRVSTLNLAVTHSGGPGSWPVVSIQNYLFNDSHKINGNIVLVGWS